MIISRSSFLGKGNVSDESCKGVLGAIRTQHSEQYPHHTYDMLPHHRIPHNDVGFFYRILI